MCLHGTGTTLALMPFPWAACNYYSLQYISYFLCLQPPIFGGRKGLLISCKVVIKAVAATCSNDCYFYCPVLAQDERGSCFSAGVFLLLGSGKSKTTSLTILTQQKLVLHYKPRWPIATTFPLSQGSSEQP